MCEVTQGEADHLVSHIEKGHGGESKISVTCPLDGCNYSTTKMKSWKSHNSRVHYLNNLNLVNVVFLFTSNHIDHDTPGNVELLIKCYLWRLRHHIPRMDFTPKCHHLQHVPQQLRRFGPSWGTWTLRFEAKHSEFKANKLVNFKNVPKTLALRCQLMMAYDMIGSDGQKSKAFFYQGDEADFEFVNTFGHLKREFELKVMTRCNYDRNTDSAGIIVPKAKTMKLECITYKLGIFLTIETNRASYW